MDSPRPKQPHLAIAIRKTFIERNDFSQHRARILPVRRIFNRTYCAQDIYAGSVTRNATRFRSSEGHVSGAQTDRYKVGQNPLSRFIATQLGTC
jgi:hypothetical protein